MSQPLYHGSIVRIKCNPLNISNFSGYLKTYFNCLCMDWQNNNSTGSLEFVVGDWKKYPAVINVNEPIELVSSDWLNCVIPRSDGNIEYINAWDRKSINRPKLILMRDNTGNVPAMLNEVYWLRFENSPIRFGTRKNDYFVCNSENNYPVLVTLESVNAITPIPSPVPDNLVIDTGLKVDYELPKQIYLTVDDSCSEYTIPLVNYINEHKLPCIFFINGSHSQKYPDALSAIVKCPYITVGIHTWSHSNMNNQLTIEQVRTELRDTINLVDNTFKANGLIWPASPRLFRFPFTDGGANYKAIQLQNVLKEFGFHEHIAIQKAIFGTGLGISGLFLEDGLYNDKSTDEYLVHVKSQMTMFKTQFPFMFEPLVFGTHDLKHELTLLKLLVTNNIEFLDAKKTF